METIETVRTSAPLFDKGKLFVKSIFIFAMTLALWLPTYFILGIVKERAGRQKEAVADISSKWATKQTVTGPILMIPYNDVAIDDKGNKIWTKKDAYFMPDKLNIRSTIFTEKRHRGIYEVAVYRSEIIIAGKFNSLAWQQLAIHPDNILWNQAVIFFKVQDNSKGINEDVIINWGGNDIVFNSQPAGQSFLTDAFSATIPLTLEEAEALRDASKPLIGTWVEFMPFGTAIRIQALVKHVVVDKRVNAVFVGMTDLLGNVFHKTPSVLTPIPVPAEYAKKQEEAESKKAKEKAEKIAKAEAKKAKLATEKEIKEAGIKAKAKIKAEASVPKEKSAAKTK